MGMGSLRGAVRPWLTIPSHPIPRLQVRAYTLAHPLSFAATPSSGQPGSETPPLGGGPSAAPGRPASSGDMPSVQPSGGSSASCVSEPGAPSLTLAPAAAAAAAGPVAPDLLEWERQAKGLEAAMNEAKDANISTTKVRSMPRSSLSLRCGAVLLPQLLLLRNNCFPFLILGAAAASPPACVPRGHDDAAAALHCDVCVSQLLVRTSGREGLDGRHRGSVVWAPVPLHCSFPHQYDPPSPPPPTPGHQCLASRRPPPSPVLRRPSGS